MEEKGWKLKLMLKHKLSTLQMCRPKNPSNYPLNPIKYSISPLKSKTFDISYPSFSLPSPPPTTPKTSSSNRHHLPKPPKPRISRKSTEYTWSYRDGRWQSEQYSDPRVRTCFKSNLGDCNRREIMSSDSGWSSSDSDDDGLFTGRDTDTLLSTSISFSNDAFSEAGSSQKFENRNKSIANLRNSGSHPNKSILCRDKETMVSSPSVMRRILPPSMAEGKAVKSVAVVKKSENPLEDFKTSMMEMVLENQMFEAKELEELLQCFLSLNRKEYHGVIVEAFAELWQALFSEFSPVNRRVS